MIKNYFRTAWRNLLKNRMYSFINITGLATGIAVGLVTVLTVNFQAIKAAIANPVKSLRTQ